MRRLSQHDVLPDTWVRCPSCLMHARAHIAEEVSGGERSRCGQCSRSYVTRDVEVATTGGRLGIVQAFVGAAEIRSQRWEPAERPRLLTDAK